MRKALSMVLAVSMVLSLAACGGSSSGSGAATSGGSSSEGESWKIGGIGPITGGAAVYGLSCKNAQQIAVDEINAAGGINGYPVEIQFEDDEHDAEKSVNAYNSLKDWGMDMLLGTTTSAPCIAVSAESVNENMFQLTPSGSAPDCIANPNTFAVCFSDPQQGEKSAEYIGTHKLATKIGILYDASDVYSTGVYESFIQEAPEQGLEIVATEQFTADNKTDFNIQLQNIRNAGAELVFLPFYYTEAALVLKQAKDMDYAPIFFGCDGMDGILNLEGFDKSLAEGLMLLTPFAADATDERTVNFVKAYQDRFNETPIQFAADMYDGMYAIKLAAEKADINPGMSVEEIGTAMEKAMTEITVEGLTGTITWSEDGAPSKEPKAVMVQDGSYKSVED
ncbi:branched-chain amino acid transport system substrate-binding protein [Fusobacterium naviforme]|nr:ABC transporter substrate-binding protein [Fusobacterium naviforme]PSL10743.1 branched-chain amino acid transport system substrate-binding protein [Fusobacterium naviforme]STO27293.1 Leucine-, isoleucine-, valine-, threonine-, and alanine-binding protein precursor [Fusobacterium naviforme]